MITSTVTDKGQTTVPATAAESKLPVASFDGDFNKFPPSPASSPRLTGRSCIWKTLLFALAVFAAAWHPRAAPFKNLDFEEANTNNLPFSDQFVRGLMADLLPGWNVLRADGSELRTLGFDLHTIGASGNDGTLLSEASRELGFGSDEKYSLGLWAGWWLIDQTQQIYPISLFQEGDVPVDAGSLRFRARISGTMILRIDGESAHLFDQPKQDPTDFFTD